MKDLGPKAIADLSTSFNRAAMHPLLYCREGLIQGETRGAFASLGFGFPLLGTKTWYHCPPPPKFALELDQWY